MATLLKQVKAFVTNQRNAGAKGLSLTMVCIDHMFEHNDWTPLAYLINTCEARDSAVLRRIVGVCVGGIKLTTKGKEAKNQPSGMVIKLDHNAGVTDKMPILRKLVEEGVSFRSKAVAEELFEKNEKPFDLPAYAKRLKAKLEKEHITVKQLLDAMV